MGGGFELCEVEAELDLSRRDGAIAPAYSRVGLTGSGSLGPTPYFRRRARPQGQPPNVTAFSMACRILAILLPLLARVQTGQRFSQNSGLQMLMLQKHFSAEVSPPPSVAGTA